MKTVEKPTTANNDHPQNHGNGPPAVSLTILNPRRRRTQGRPIHHRRRSTGSCTTQLYSSDEEDVVEVVAAVATTTTTSPRPPPRLVQSLTSGDNNNDDDDYCNKVEKQHPRRRRGPTPLRPRRRASKNKDDHDLETLEAAVRRRLSLAVGGNHPGASNQEALPATTTTTTIVDATRPTKEKEATTRREATTADATTQSPKKKRVRFSSNDDVGIHRRPEWNPTEHGNLYWTAQEIREMQQRAVRWPNDNVVPLLLLRACLELAHDWHTANVEQQRQEGDDNSSVLQDEHAALQYLYNWQPPPLDEDDDENNSNTTVSTSTITLRGLEQFLCPSLVAFRNEYRRRLVREWQPRYHRSTALRGLATQSRRATAPSQRLARLVAHADARQVGTVTAVVVES